MGKIHIAARAGDLKMVQQLIEVGDGLFSKTPVPVDEPYTKPMFGAEEGVLVNETALACAVRNNRLDVVKYLRSKGAKIEPGNLGVALGNQNYDMLTYLKDDAHVPVEGSNVYSAIQAIFNSPKKSNEGYIFWVNYVITHFSSASEDVAKSLHPSYLEEYTKQVDGKKYSIQHTNFIKFFFKVNYTPGKLDIPNFLKCIQSYNTNEPELYDYIIDLILGDSFILYNTMILGACIFNKPIFLERCKLKNIECRLHFEEGEVHGLKFKRDGALLIATKFASDKVVAWLLNNEADPFIETADGKSLLTVAAAAIDNSRSSHHSVGSKNATIEHIKIAQQAAKNKQKELERKAALASLTANTPVSSQADTFTWEAIVLMDKIYQDPAAMKRYTQLLEQALIENPHFVPALLALRAVTCNLAYREKLENQIKQSNALLETETWFKEKMHMHPGASYLFGNFLYIHDIRTDEASTLYKTASMQNIVQAKFGLGLISADKKHGVELYTEAANKGFKLGAFWAARAYIYGEGVEKDVSRGIDLAQEALAAGIHSAYLLLGHAYHYVCEKKDYKEALKMYHLSITACEEDFKKYGGDRDSDVVCDKIRAQLSIARCYWDGADDIFGANSHVQARDWAQKVMAQTSSNYLKDTYDSAKSIVDKADKHSATLQKSASMHSQYTNANSGNPTFSVPLGVQDRSARPTVYGKK